MNDPKQQNNGTGVKPRKPASSPEKDASRDMLEDADHIGVPLEFDEDGNVVGGTDPTRGG